MSEKIKIAEELLQKNKNFISLKLKSLNDNGYINGIKIDENNQEYKQIRNCNWKHIPMFFVITGTNGIGKSSVLKFINDSVLRFYKESKLDNN